jgi:hypothetical protein
MSNSKSSSQGAPLREKLLANIAAHLNDDHRDDLLACAKVKGKLDWAEEVTVTSLDGTGIHLDVRGGGKRQSLRLEFPSEVHGVLGLRSALETMINESRND